MLGAILGGMVGAIPWAIVSHFGWFVGWLGFLIGICAIKGYEILGGRPGKPKVVIIVLATILGVAFGQVAATFITISTMIAGGEIPWLSYGQIPQFFILLLANDADFLFALLKDFGLGLVFAALGIWRLIASVAVESKRTVAVIPRNETPEEPPQEGP